MRLKSALLTKGKFSWLQEIFLVFYPQTAKAFLVNIDAALYLLKHHPGSFITLAQQNLSPQVPIPGTLLLKGDTRACIKISPRIHW